MGVRPCVSQMCASDHSSAMPTTQGLEQVFVTPRSSFNASSNLPSALPEDGDGEDGSSSDEEDKFFEAPEEFVSCRQDVAFPQPAVGEEGPRDSSPGCGDYSSRAKLMQEGSSVAGEHCSLGSQREGVLHPLEGMLLLATGEQLCVPVTQDPGPLTEDLMAEQEQVLARLGTSEEAALIRARLQAGSLLSDMQAFKASLLQRSYTPCACIAV